MNIRSKRSKKQLQKAWERIKTKREEKKTGGGAPTLDVSKDVEKVLSLIAPEVNDLGCSFDDDTLLALESVTIEVDPDDPKPVNLSEGLPTVTPGPSKDTPLSVHEKNFASTRKRRRLRTSLYDDDNYTSQEKIRNLTEEDAEMCLKLLSHRQTIFDLQKKKQAEIRLQETVEKLEETRQSRKLNALNKELLQEKLKEAKINRQIAEAKAAEMGLPIWL
ncbi:hypothetical protein Pmani_013240 [Petrolisthes manimaculis]|uniref:Uncharacterized protein n=1 Tax=Petrolisthes manimaculis TaxID=1843537 RepID=A0AAE1PWD1_9EUCA|nr:hypothetical protein Pmani_013240 [Petrolisthes manimaculis]